MPHLISLFVTCSTLMSLLFSNHLLPSPNNDNDYSAIVVHKELSREQCAMVFGTQQEPECPTTDSEGCGPERFCFDNNCTGNPTLVEIVPGSGVMITVKDCGLAVTHSLLNLMDQYEEPVNEETSGLTEVTSVKKKCNETCVCSQYCFYEAMFDTYLCDITNDCVNTDEVDDVTDTEEGECPEEPAT